MEYKRLKSRLVTRRSHALWISGFLLFTIFYVGFYLQNEELNLTHSNSKDVFSKDVISIGDVKWKSAQLDAAKSNLVNSFTNDLMVMANMGSQWTTLEKLEELVGSQDSLILPRMKQIYGSIQSDRRKQRTRMEHNGHTINLAVVSCGWRRLQLSTMLKTAMTFSQDAALHLILFSDESSILGVACDVLELKWTVNALGWDFTYELHLDWFPGDDVGWGQMYAPCATQRLFFPSLLPHIDSLIYLDTDVLVLSNLTELWLKFQDQMKEKKMAAIAANNEPTSDGWYRTGTRIPHYGKRGLNAGVMLMNLTQMREFNFEKRAMAAQVLYNGKLDLADQDIINIIFHGFPERMHQLDCSHNFNWVHCGDDGSLCRPGITYCFCNATFSNGIQILHGNGGTFERKEYHPFLVEIYQSFQRFDLLRDSTEELLDTIRQNFTAHGRPCGPLSSDMLLRNARKYFLNLNNKAVAASF